MLTDFEKRLAHMVWARCKEERILVLSRTRDDGGTFYPDPIRGQTEEGIPVEGLEDGYSAVIAIPSRITCPCARYRLSVMVHEYHHYLQYQAGWRSSFWMELHAGLVQWVLVHWRLQGLYPHMKNVMVNSWWRCR